MPGINRLILSTALLFIHQSTLFHSFLRLYLKILLLLLHFPVSESVRIGYNLRSGKFPLLRGAYRSSRLLLLLLHISIWLEYIFPIKYLTRRHKFLLFLYILVQTLSHTFKSVLLFIENLGLA